MRDLRERILHEIHDERCRQIVREGYTTEHDDEHRDGSLAKAASCYAMCAGVGVASAAGLERHYEFVAEYRNAQPPAYDCWPWEPAAWKPKSPRQDLIKAAALIVAELERMDRATESEGERHG